MKTHCWTLCCWPSESTSHSTPLSGQGGRQKWSGRIYFEWHQNSCSNVAILS